jgi:protoporphyrinogen oxidase
MFLATRARSFERIEALTAREWIERGSGPQVYEILWRRLMELKFYEFADEISASWIATRVKRIGKSRRSILQEELGYIDGGSETLVDALVSSIRARGGRIHLRAPAERILTDNGRVTGVAAGSRFIPADEVISTVPIPLVNKLIPDLPNDWKAKYASIRNIGVVCVVYKLRRSVSKHFWLNIVDPEIEIPGLIEFSNLRPLPAHIVYVPYYMPTTHPKWTRGDDAFIREAFGYIRRLNPAISEGAVADCVGIG